MIQNVCVEVLFQPWMQVSGYKSRMAENRFITLLKETCLFQASDTKLQHRAGLSLRIWRKAEPQRASWHSTCHVQLVPQRESSSTKRKMGLIMEFLFYSQL